MTTLLFTILLGTIFTLFAYHVSNGNTLMDLFSALALLILVVWLLPELRGLPLVAYGSVWLFGFVGLHFCLPMAEGKRHLWLWQTPYVMVGVAVRG